VTYVAKGSRKEPGILIQACTTRCMTLFESLSVLAKTFPETTDDVKRTFRKEQTQSR
jgi:hypothetical protein